MTAEEYFKKYGRFPAVPMADDGGNDGGAEAVPAAPRPAGVVADNFLADRPLKTGIPQAPIPAASVGAPLPQAPDGAALPQTPDKWGEYHAAVNRDAVAYGLKAPEGMSAQEFGLVGRSTNGAIAPQYREGAMRELDRLRGVQDVGAQRAHEADMMSRIPAKPAEATVVGEGGMAIVPGMGVVRNERKFEPQAAESPWTSTPDGKTLYNKTSGERQVMDPSGKTVKLAADEILVDEGGRVLAKNLKDMDFSDSANMARNLDSIMKNYIFLSTDMKKKVDEYLLNNTLSANKNEAAGAAKPGAAPAAGGAAPIWVNPKRK